MSVRRPNRSMTLTPSKVKAKLTSPMHHGRIEPKQKASECRDDRPEEHFALNHGSRYQNVYPNFSLYLSSGLLLSFKFL
jgi:hypothetical protein